MKTSAICVRLSRRVPSVARAVFGGLALLGLVGCAIKNLEDSALVVFDRTPYVRSDRNSVTIPLLKGRQGFLFLPGRIGSSEVLFLVSTGSDKTIVSSSVAAKERLQMKRVPAELVSMNGENRATVVAIVPSIYFGDFELQYTPVMVENLDAVTPLVASRQDEAVGGILGTDVWELLGARIDFRERTLILYRPSS